METEEGSSETCADATEPRQLTEAEVLLCGAAAGTASRAVLNPLDVLKIRLQIQQESSSTGYATQAHLRRASLAMDASGRLAQRGAETVASTSAVPKYSGALDALRVIVREEGLRGLWRGIVPGLCLVVPYSAVQFLVYDAANRKCREWRMKGTDGTHTECVVPVAAERALPATFQGRIWNRVH